MFLCFIPTESKRVIAQKTSARRRLTRKSHSNNKSVRNFNDSVTLCRFNARHINRRTLKFYRAFTGYSLIPWVFLLISCILPVYGELSVHNSKLGWMIGKWRSEFSGKIVWPTVPTMTYGEELIIGEAPSAKTTKSQFFNYSARAWSHSTKDHFHDEWGFMTVDSNGNATLMTTGNNGFTTYEVGTVRPNKLVLTLKDIGRISFSRDLPVEDLRRTFIRHDDTYMEQILEMRTATHPKSGYLEHTRVIYSKVSNLNEKQK